MFASKLTESGQGAFFSKTAEGEDKLRLVIDDEFVAVLDDIFDEFFVFAIFHNGETFGFLEGLAAAADENAGGGWRIENA